MKNQIDIINILTGLDWTIFFLVAIVTIGFVIWGQSKKKHHATEEESFIDLMLMGRQLTLPMFVATLVATYYGGIFGVAQIAFDNGIFSFVTQGFFWYISYFIFAFFIAHRIKNSIALTLPDFVGKMYGPKAEKISALFNFINLIPIAYAISMGLFIKLLFGVALPIGISIGVIFVLAYSIFGGFRAVVFSDLVQFFVMCSSVILVFACSYFEFGFAPLYSLPSRYYDPTGGYSLLETLSWGLIAITTLVDPNFYQRTFAARDLKTAKYGILISTAIWIIFDLSLTFGALYAKAIIPEANSEHGYFIYAMQILPSGLRGFVLAGIAATVLSTLDSYLFLAGSTLAYDLVPKKYKGKVIVHHFGILIVGIIAIVMSLLFDGNIKNVWKTLGSLSSSSLLVPILLGLIYKRKLSDHHFIFSSILGAIATMSWRLSPLQEYWELDSIYVGVFISLISFLIYDLFKLNQKVS